MVDVTRAGKRAEKIADVVSGIGTRTLPFVHEHTSLAEVIEVMARTSHSRLVYVVDSGGRLVGTISLGTLVRHLFAGSHEPRVHPRSLLSMITRETARDFMVKHPIQTTAEDDVEDVMRLMIAKNIKEIAVVNAEGVLVADITMIDLLRCCR